MSASHWIGWLGGFALIAFIVFAFRQGMKVKPHGRANMGGYAGDGHGHSGDGGGHAGHA